VSSRFKGYRKNTGSHPSGHAMLAAHKAAAALPPLALPDLRTFNGPILDQGQAGSCVAFAGARQLALFLRANMLTPDWILPSPLWGYVVGRLQEYAGQDPDALPATALDDVGTMPAHYLLAIRNLGFVRWADWPYPTDTATLDNAAKMLALVGEKPPAEVVEKAFPQTGLEYAVYDGPAAERMGWIRDCLLHRLPVTFGHEVDDAYEANTGEVVRSIDVGASLGGHDECIVAINDAGNVIVAGSWTTDFGTAGFTEWSPEAIESDACSDFQIVKASPLPEVA
jgi:hypothetical protein